MKMEEKIFDTEFLKKLNNISLKASITMNQGASGSRKSRVKGSSVEFSDYREYTPGDDFRRVDWNAFGRFDKLFVKLFMEEREAMVNIFIDSSKSMNFGEPKKSIAALRIASVLAFLALNNLDRVCLNSIREGALNKSSSLMGRNMFNRCITYLQGIEFSGRTTLCEAIKKKELTARGISIIISDFFTDGDIEEAVKYLTFKKQQVILIHLLSPEELNPELSGELRLIDSETGLAKNVSVTASVLKKYNVYLNSFTKGIKECSSKMGAAYVQVSSSDPIEKVLFEKFLGSGIISY